MMKIRLKLLIIKECWRSHAVPSPNTKDVINIEEETVDGIRRIEVPKLYMSSTTEEARSDFEKEHSPCSHGMFCFHRPDECRAAKEFNCQCPDCADINLLWKASLRHMSILHEPVSFYTDVYLETDALCFPDTVVSSDRSGALGKVPKSDLGKVPKRRTKNQKK